MANTLPNDGSDGGVNQKEHLSELELKTGKISRPDEDLRRAPAGEDRVPIK